MRVKSFPLFFFNFFQKLTYLCLNQINHMEITFNFNKLSGSEFPILDTIDIVDEIILFFSVLCFCFFLMFVAGCPVHCRLLRSIPGLYSLDVSSIPSCDNQRCPQTLPYVLWGKTLLLVENHSARWF